MLTNKIGCVSHKHGAKHTSYVMCAWIFHLSSHSYLNLSHLIKSKKGIVIPPRSQTLWTPPWRATSCSLALSIATSARRASLFARSNSVPCLPTYLLRTCLPPDPWLPPSLKPSSIWPPCEEVCKLEPNHPPVPVWTSERGEVPEQQQRRPELARGGRPLLMTDCTVDAGETDWTDWSFADVPQSRGLVFWLIFMAAIFVLCLMT